MAFSRLRTRILGRFYSDSSDPFLRTRLQLIFDVNILLILLAVAFVPLTFLKGGRVEQTISVSSLLATLASLSLLVFKGWHRSAGIITVAQLYFSMTTCITMGGGTVGPLEATWAAALAIYSHVAVGTRAGLLMTVVGFVSIGVFSSSLFPWEIVNGSSVFASTPYDLIPPVLIIVHSVRQFLLTAEYSVDEIREKQHRYQAVFTHSGVGIALVSFNGEIIDANSAFCEMLGQGSGKLAGRKLQAFTHADDVPKEAELLKALLQANKRGASEYEKRFVDREGDIIWGMVHASIFMRENRPAAWLLVVQDISVRKGMESDLIDAKQSAERVAEFRSTFLANMSHEIRTPMNGILGMAQLLGETELNPVQRDYVEVIYSSAGSLLGVINDVLDLAKLERGRVELESTPFEIEEPIWNAIQTCQAAARKQGNAVSYQIARDVPHEVQGDVTRFKQVILNLLSNAIKFTNEGNIRVEVDCMYADARETVVKVSVRDTGVGIPEDRLASIFDSFTQADPSTTRKYGGTGWGLSISKQLVEIMGGRIWVMSTEGKGTTFSFTVKFKQCTASGLRRVEDGKIRNALAPSSSTMNQAQKISVLVAEDNEINQKLVTLMLKKLGYQVKIVGDGLEAVEEMRQDRHDLILMDMQMPRMDGLEATELILQEHLYPPPVIAMTANVLPEDRARCVQAGMVDLLPKPIRLQDLEDMIRRWTSHQASLPAT